LAAWDEQHIIVEAHALELNAGYITFSLEFPSFEKYKARKDAARDSTF